MSRKMKAINSIPFPFVTINKGDVVEVSPSTKMFDQDISCVSINTPLGELAIHISTESVESLFEDVDGKNPEPEKFDAEWINQLLERLGGQPQSGKKPHVKVATSPAKYFVIRDLHEDAKVGAIVTVTGHLADGGVALKLPNGIQAQCSKAFFNHVIPANSQQASSSIDDLKRKHYLSQGFLSSGGLLVKRIDGRHAQVVKEDNLDIVRVLIDSKLAQAIEVDWS